MLIDFWIAEKYDIVGRLLKPGEEPSNYSEDEDGDQDQRTDEEREKNKDDWSNYLKTTTNQTNKNNLQPTYLLIYLPIQMGLSKFSVSAGKHISCRILSSS